MTDALDLLIAILKAFDGGDLVAREGSEIVKLIETYGGTVEAVATKLEQPNDLFNQRV